MAKKKPFYLRPEKPVPTHPTLLPDAPVETAVGPLVGLRQVLNWINLSTPFGLLVAKIGGARIRRGPGRSYVADYYRWTFPSGGAFTIGDVVLSRHDMDLLQERRPTLIQHELVHSVQWAYCGGLPFMVLYAFSMLWSWLRTGSRSSYSFFERQAGLRLGGYEEVQPTPLVPRLARLARMAVGGRRGLGTGADLGRGGGDG